MTTTPEVLFVCIHNAGRSQMAAALLDHHAAGRVHVRSAGSTPASEINPAVREVMNELGVNLSKEFPKPECLGDRRQLSHRVRPPARDRLRRVRGTVIQHGWQQHRFIGRPLRWIGKHTP
ncbi:MAG: hypothetical protein ACR2KJ_08645 [Jatrophihabitans sp.]